MPDHIVQGRKLYVGGRDLSGDWTAINLSAGREAIEFTKGQDSLKRMGAGMRTVSLEAEGVVDLGADLSDEELFASADTLVDQPIVVTPTAGLAGDPAYAFRAGVGDYDPFSGADVGGRLNFRVTARAYTGRLVRGRVIVDTAAVRNATFNGTAFQFAGGVPTGKKLYACVQVVAATGTTPTLDGIIQSDNAAGMSSPTTVATFSQRTAAGQHEWLEVSGPITDDYFRFVGTIAGTSPAFTVVVFAGIA